MGLATGSHLDYFAFVTFVPHCSLDGRTHPVRLAPAYRQGLLFRYDKGEDCDAKRTSASDPDGRYL